MQVETGRGLCEDEPLSGSGMLSACLLLYGELAELQSVGVMGARQGECTCCCSVEEDSWSLL